MEYLRNERHQLSKKIGGNIRTPFDIIIGLGLPSGAIKKQIYNDHNKVILIRD